MIKQDYQLQQLLNIEDEIAKTSDKDIPRKVYVGEGKSSSMHFCYWDGEEGFLATFDSPNTGRLVAGMSYSDDEELRNMKYILIEFDDAMLLSLQKPGLFGVIHFFLPNEYKKVYNGR